LKRDEGQRSSALQRCVGYAIDRLGDAVAANSEKQYVDVGRDGGPLGNYGTLSG
jgi:hypothetical protein